MLAMVKRSPSKMQMGSQVICNYATCVKLGSVASGGTRAQETRSELSTVVQTKGQFILFTIHDKSQRDDLTKQQRYALPETLNVIEKGLRHD